MSIFCNLCTQSSKKKKKKNIGITKHEQNILYNMLKKMQNVSL